VNGYLNYSCFTCNIQLLDISTEIIKTTKYGEKPTQIVDFYIGKILQGSTI